MAKVTRWVPIAVSPGDPVRYLDAAIAGHAGEPHDCDWARGDQCCVTGRLDVDAASRRIADAIVAEVERRGGVASIESYPQFDMDYLTWRLPLPPPA